MEIKGDSLIAASQNAVWTGLNDPEILRQAIPGCESLEKTGENQFKATVVTRIGPITAKFNGEVELQDLNPPNSYTISGSGSAGAMGAAKGRAFVTLTPKGEETHLDYRVEADISGKIAQLGGRLIQSTAGILAGQFFNKFSTLVGDPTSQTTQAAQKQGGIPKAVLIVGGLIVLVVIAFLVLK